ncbi:chymotrypsin-like serine protease precursor [Aphelenchoides avenae]|nr:chymotrypsin-like serine protease precursor [Aphelenchus avenae]
MSESRWNVTYNGVDHQARENIVHFRTLGRCASVKTPLDYILRHSEKTICAVGYKRDTAQGDSGGPIMINRKGAWYQVGTTSLGSMFEDDDCKIKWSSLYSRLSRACEWIEEVTGDDVKCASMKQ